MSSQILAVQIVDCVKTHSLQVKLDVHPKQISYSWPSLLESVIDIEASIQAFSYSSMKLPAPLEVYLCYAPLVFKPFRCCSVCDHNK